MRFRVIRPAPLEFLLVGGFVSAVLSCAAAALAFSDIPDRVVTVAITVAVYATRGRSLISASATATMAWMFLTGFLVNDAGTLTFSPDDRVRLGILLATGLLGGAVGVLRALQPGGRPSTGERGSHLSHHGFRGDPGNVGRHDGVLRR